MQLKEALAQAVVDLTEKQVPSPRMNAELLLMFALGVDRAYLYGHSEHKLSDDEQNRYNSAIAERARGVPTQYITGHQEFWGLDFIVTPEVLIPRPETEHVIETVLELISDRKRALRIVDVGTGSGCIAVALAKELPKAEIHATDSSNSALQVARTNAARLEVENRVRYHHTDLLAGLSPPFDFVLSNPPYVGESESDSVQLEVRKFEPRSAVFAGPTGLEVISRLIPQAYDVLRGDGWLIMEISGTIAEKTKQLLTNWDFEFIPDLQSIPRVVRARKRPR